MVMQDVNHQLFTDSVEAEVLLSMKDEDRIRTASEKKHNLSLFTIRKQMKES